MLTGSPQSVVQGHAINFAAQVASSSSMSSGVPTGSVEFLLDGNPQTLPIQLINNAAAYVLDTTSVAYGMHSVEAQYFGDSTFAGSQGSFAINVTAPAPDFSLIPSSTSVNVKSGSSVTVPISVGCHQRLRWHGPIQYDDSEREFQPQRLTITGAGSYSTTLTLNAFTPAVRMEKGLAPHARTSSWNEIGLGISLLEWCLFAFPRRRRFARVLAV